jgi:hypothetical protein
MRYLWVIVGDILMSYIITNEEAIADIKFEQTQDVGLVIMDDSYSAPLNSTDIIMKNTFTDAYTKQSDFDFEGSVAVFYATLLDRQEPLGAEFEKILYDNLWELYDN